MTRQSPQAPTSASIGFHLPAAHKPSASTTFSSQRSPSPNPPHGRFSEQPPYLSTSSVAAKCRGEAFCCVGRGFIPRRGQVMRENCCSNEDQRERNAWKSFIPSLGGGRP